MEHLTNSYWINATHKYSINGTIPSCESVSISTVAKWIMVSSYVLIFFIGVIGNSVVIYILGIKRQLVRSFDVQIVSLATMNVISAIFIPMVAIHNLAVELRGWKLLGGFGCKLFVSIEHITILTSAFLLILISMDRLRIVGTLNEIENTPPMVLKEFLVTGVASICIVYSYASALTVKHNTCYTWGWMPLDIFIYCTIYASMCCVLPAFFLTIVYIKILCLMSRMDVPRKGAIMTRNGFKIHKRLVKMFMGVSLVFIVLTTPCMINRSIITFHVTFKFETYCEHVKVLLLLDHGLRVLSHFSCCVNPFIYANMYTSMQRTYEKQNVSNWISLRETKSSGTNETHADDPSCSMGYAKIITLGNNQKEGNCSKSGGKINPIFDADD